jgi:H+/Cl- antiporter ClcA
VLIVGMGVSLGREGAPKQAGAVMANFFSDRGRLSDEQRRLLVACGAGAGMGAAYGVPLGGALFALEVMRGMLALRYVLPALFASVIATAVFVGCATRRADLRHPRLFEFSLKRGLGAARRSDRGCGLRRLCANCQLG